MHDHLDGLRKYFQYAALGCTIASAWLTFLFGMQQSPAWYVAVACAGSIREGLAQPATSDATLRQAIPALAHGDAFRRMRARQALSS